MVKLVLNDDQTRLVESNEGSLEIVGSSGRRLGFLAPSIGGKPKRVPLTIEEAEELARRINSGGPFCTMQDVLDHARSMESR